MSEHAEEQTQPAQPLEQRQRPIPFGPKPHQVMRLDVAEMVLRDLFATEPVTFARLMARAYGIDDADIAPAPRGRGRGKGADAP